MVNRCRDYRRDVLHVSYHIVENLGGFQNSLNQTFLSDLAAFDVLHQMPEKRTYNFKDWFVLCVRELTDWFSQVCSSSEGKEMKEDVDGETQN